MDKESLDVVLTDYDNNPELIDNSPQTAPSKRIINAIAGDYKYNKPVSGAYVTEEIGIDKLLNMCQHFREWVQKLLAAGGVSLGC